MPNDLASVGGDPERATRYRRGMRLLVLATMVVGCDGGKAASVQQATRDAGTADAGERQALPMPPSSADDPWGQPDPSPSPRAVDAATRSRGREHLRRLSDEMRKRGLSSSFTVGADPSAVLFDGPCSRANLDDLARRMGPSFRSFGFVTIECLDLSARL